MCEDVPATCGPAGRENSGTYGFGKHAHACHQELVGAIAPLSFTLRLKGNKASPWECASKASGF